MVTAGDKFGHLCAIFAEVKQLGINAKRAGQIGAGMLIISDDHFFRAFAGNAEYILYTVGKADSIGAVGQSAHTLNIGIVRVTDDLLQQGTDLWQISFDNSFWHVWFHPFLIYFQHRDNDKAQLRGGM